MNRLFLALAAFVGLGLLSWATISDGKIRLVTAAILAMFAVKTLLHRKDKDSDKLPSDEPSAAAEVKKR